MARLSLVEAAMKVSAIQALRGHSLKAVSRAKRLELAPKHPNAATLQYLKLMRSYQREVVRLTQEILLPALPTQDSFRTVGTRGDPGSPAENRGPALAEAGAQTFRKDDTKNLDDAFADLNAQLTALADRMAPAIGTVARAVTKQANAQVARMLNIDLRGGESSLEPFVQDFIAKNIALVKSVNFDQLAKLRTIISEHTAKGGGVKELRENLMDSFGLTRQRATLIAKDQILKAAAATNELRQKQVGVTTYTWSTSEDERVRPDHAKLDGTVQDWSNPPIVDEKSGRREHPGQDFSCRCVAIANVAALLGREAYE